MNEDYLNGIMQVALHAATALVMHCVLENVPLVIKLYSSNINQFSVFFY